MPNITEDVVKATAENAWNGKGILTLLLDRRGDDVHITEVMKDLVKAAITEDVVKAAAKNPKCGKELIMLLLDRCGNDVHITEDVVKAAVGNLGNGKDASSRPARE
ncbi:hypothetical protein V8E54_000474 [Elaphomyces granulatus]